MRVRIVPEHRMGGGMLTTFLDVTRATRSKRWSRCFVGSFMSIYRLI
ncbi:hypothetical protein MKZ91_11925 [Ensifer sp. MJa1]